MKRERHLRPVPESVRAARNFVTDTLVGLAPDTVDRVALMVSELATNSVVHARSEFWVRVETDAREVRVEVTDTGAGVATPRHPEPTDLHGRGLLIVDNFSDAWGLIAAPAGQGKTVWFTLRVVTDAPALG